MNQQDIKKFFRPKPTILYPLDVVKTCESMEVDFNFATTCKINDLCIPSLIIKCDQRSLNSFGIGIAPSEPVLQFRMINLLNRDFVLEIVLHFSNSAKMRLHLNPANKIVHHFLRQLQSTTVISFHFYSQEEKIFTSAITTLDEDQIKWVDRNLKLAPKLRANNDSDMITNFLIKDSTGPNDKIYKFKNIDNEIHLAEFATEFISFQKVGSDMTNKK